MGNSCPCLSCFTQNNRAVQSKTDNLSSKRIAQELKSQIKSQCDIQSINLKVKEATQIPIIRSDKFTKKKKDQNCRDDSKQILNIDGNKKEINKINDEINLEEINGNLGQQQINSIHQIQNSLQLAGGKLLQQQHQSSIIQSLIEIQDRNPELFNRLQSNQYLTSLSKQDLNLISIYMQKSLKIANIHETEKKYESALTIYQNNLELANKIKSNANLIQNNYKICQKIGNIYFMHKKYAEAVPYLSMSLKQSINQDSVDTLNLLTKLGLAQYETKNAIDALQSFQKCLKIEQVINNQSKQDKLRLAELLNLKGLTLILLQKQQESIELNNKCLKIKNQLGCDVAEKIINYGDICFAYFAQKQYKKSILACQLFLWQCLNSKVQNIEVVKIYYCAGDAQYALTFQEDKGKSNEEKIETRSNGIMKALSFYESAYKLFIKIQAKDNSVKILLLFKLQECYRYFKKSDFEQQCSDAILRTLIQSN